MLPDLWVLTVAPNSRAHEVDALRASMPDVAPHRFVTVTTQPDPIPGALLFDSDDLNIAKWWTVGLEHIARYYETQPYDVFIVESDTRITPADLDAVRAEMRRTGCVMAGADWQSLLPAGVTLVRRSLEPMDRRFRLPGIGLVVAGEAGLRHDTQFRWWYVDDDLEWQARASGGTALVGGTTLTHTGGSPMVGDRARFAQEDVVKFDNKWGGTPQDGGRVRG
jgi:hypothetical protein